MNMMNPVTNGFKQRQPGVRLLHVNIQGLQIGHDARVPEELVPATERCAKGFVFEIMMISDV